MDERCLGGGGFQASGSLTPNSWGQIANATWACLSLSLMEAHIASLAPAICEGPAQKINRFHFNEGTGMKRSISVLCAAAAFFTIGAAKADDAPPAAAAPALDPVLQARLAAEKEARKQCKTDICKAFAAGKAAPGAVTCDAAKTWLDSQIQDQILSGRISWPWGHAKCSAHIDLDREAIAKLLANPEAQIKLKQHTLTCLVDKKGGEGKVEDSYVVKFSVAPEITFKDAKAAAVKLNWSDIEAPTLLQGAIWSATALDKTFNVLGGSAVTEINKFIYDRCKEVGVEIAAKN